MATTARGLHARSDLQVPSEPIVYNELAIRSNMSILSYCRTFVSALSGSSAGILGLTGLEGFFFYFIVSFVFSAMLFIKAGRNWQEFFRFRQPLITSGLLGGLFTYVLFWTQPEDLASCFELEVRELRQILAMWPPYFS